MSTAHPDPPSRKALLGYTSAIVALPILFWVGGLFPAACRQPEPVVEETVIQENDTIAIVNNKRISLTTFQRRLSAFLKQYGYLAIDGRQQLTKVKEIVMNQLVDEELMTQEASRRGIRFSAAEVETELQKSLSENPYDTLRFHLNDTGEGEEEWILRLRQHLLFRKLIWQEVLEKIPITKREISSYYDDHRQDFIVPPSIRVRNITLTTQAEAVAIRSMLQRGVDFSQLVREHSISPDKNSDGDLGYITRGELPLEMETEIFPPDVRRRSQFISDIIRSQDGFHILKMEGYRHQTQMTLDEARPLIKQILLEKKRDEAYQKWLLKLRQSASISIDQAMLTREEGF
jgi:parvulin-like peptidyl-prolyl isomerase